MCAQSCLTLLWPHELLCPWDSPGKNIGVGCHFLLQRIFLTQGSNPCLLHWHLDSLPLSILGRPDSSNISRSSKLKTFWKGFIILDAIKNIYESWEKIKISTLTESGKKLIEEHSHVWLWGVQDLSEGSNCRCGGKCKRTRIRMELEENWIAAISE